MTDDRLNELVQHEIQSIGLAEEVGCFDAKQLTVYLTSLAHAVRKEVAEARAATPPAAPSDSDVLAAMSTFYNGCDFTLHFKSDGRVFLAYGCYGVHWNLVQGARYDLSRWLGMNGPEKEIRLSPETLLNLKSRPPCERCGGFTFEPLSALRASRPSPEPKELVTARKS